MPITQFCDAAKLTPRQRLELFVPVCQAIQHAHQKGVVHRDIKPSNVLIALYDDRPLPKVIDFGVAKAAGQSLTDRTLMTGFGAVVGTPEYMSPEQANLNNLDVDTRSDVYSLGVLLYELLTGTTPVDRKSLGQAAVLEVLRIVREVEAQRPSAKLSTSATLASVAACRGTEPAKLGRQMKGELDWIALKALEKDRGRRYETATGLAADVQRYLSGEPVQAVPPSLGYRMRKAYRRNKCAVIAAGSVLAVLVAGVVGTTLGLVRALGAEQQAKEGRNTATMAEVEAKRSAEHARAANRRGLDAMHDLATELCKRNRVQVRVTDGFTVFNGEIHVATMPASEQMLLNKIIGFYEAFVAEIGESREDVEAQAVCFAGLSEIRRCAGNDELAEKAQRSSLMLWSEAWV